MLTRDDIEGFLDRLSAEGETYEEIEQGLWVVRPGGNLELDVVVHFSPPVVLLRVRISSVCAAGGWLPVKICAAASTGTFAVKRNAITLAGQPTA